MSLDLREMLKAGLHFGHRTSRWSPKMRPYIWGSKNKIHLIDISKTAFLLERTAKYLKDLAADGGTFLFVGTKAPAQDIIKAAADRLKMSYVINRWIGGTLSNYDQVKKAVTRLLHLQDIINKADTNHTKKELVMINKEIGRLERNVGGIIHLKYPPSAVIVIDGKREQSAVKEANTIGLPVIALVDTNTDPRGISCVIPGNDDSPKSIKFVVDYLEAAIAEGQEIAKTKKLEKTETKTAKATTATKKTAPKEKDVPSQEKKVAAPKETKEA